MLFDYSGVLHIHSKHSDGSADLKAIAKAASKSGANFIFINDHDTLDGLYLEGEAYHHGVLVLVGSEVTPKRNHFLCYDIATVPSNFLAPREYVSRVYQQGGFGFLAHPDQKENPIFPGRMHWDSWDLDHPFGIEIWNFFSQWMGSFRTISGLFKSFFFPKALLRPPQKETLLRWDNIGQKRPVPAIAGVDAHGGRQLSWVPNILSSYLYQFKTLRTHVLTKEPLQGILEKDRYSILSAIRKGSCYLVNHCAGKVDHFCFNVDYLEQKWHMGEEVKFKSGMLLNIKLPAKANLRIIKNGKIYSATNSQTLKIPISGPGVYRVEVYKGKIWPRPWIFSNHIYIRA